jgi:hypothetical protein
MLVCTACCFSLPAVTVSVETASYIGAGGADGLNGVCITHGGTIVAAGKLDGEISAVTQRVIDKGTSGALIGFSPDASSILSITRIGTSVSDIECGVQGEVAVCGDFGVALFDSDPLVFRWQKSFDTPVARIAVGSDGTLGIIRGNRLEVLDSAGALLGSVSVRARMLNDIIVDSKNRQVIVTGFNNKYGYSNPVQVAFIHSFPYDCAGKNWTAYDWPGEWLDGDDPVHNELGNMMADTRGYRLALGPAGHFYYAGECAGGNTMYMFSPVRWGEKIELVHHDEYSHGYNLSTDHVTFIGKYRCSDGEVVTGTFLIPRRPWSGRGTGKGETCRPRGIDIADDGTVYVCGRNGCCIQYRDSMTVNGIPLAPNDNSELYVCVLSADFSRRLMWANFSTGQAADLGCGWGIAVGDERAVCAGTVAGPSVAVDPCIDKRAPDAEQTDGYLIGFPLQPERPVPTMSHNRAVSTGNALAEYSHVRVITAKEKMRHSDWILYRLSGRKVTASVKSTNVIIRREE